MQVAVSGWAISRGQAILGIAGGVALILSAAAHSLMGWPVMRTQLESTHAPADLIRGLGVGWHFGGVAMVAFGVIVLHLFAKCLRGERPSLMPVTIIAVAYIAFGAWALFISRFELFFLFVFVVPGLVLASASRLPSRPGEIDPADGRLSD
ncbi:MAG TPA: hypothetical protein VM733_07205 [Thermoanaerobaculia bacterium]|nr:hypothetical protein [Thermoanaerobaculia bacterium]